MSVNDNTPYNINQTNMVNLSLITDEYDSADDYTDDDTPSYMNCADQEYDPEEKSRTKYTLVFCNTYMHNPLCPEDTALVGGHFITYGRLKKLNMVYIQYLQCGSIDLYTARLEIAQCIDLPSGYRISIIKTFWLKIIQRAWKKIHAIRKSVIHSRMQIQSLLYKQINGKWPPHCAYLPGLIRLLTRL